MAIAEALDFATLSEVVGVARSATTGGVLNPEAKLRCGQVMLALTESSSFVALTIHELAIADGLVAEDIAAVIVIVLRACASTVVVSSPGAVPMARARYRHVGTGVDHADTLSVAGKTVPIFVAYALGEGLIADATNTFGLAVVGEVSRGAACAGSSAPEPLGGVQVAIASTVNVAEAVIVAGRATKGAGTSDLAPFATIAVVAAA